jgi:hypothetical protein
LNFSRRTLSQVAFSRRLPALATILLTAALLPPAGSSVPRATPQTTDQNNGVPPGGPLGGPPGPPLDWVKAATTNELSIIDDNGALPLRYRVRKIDARSDTTREEIETRQGDVARLIERNGLPITAQEDKAEKDRLNAILQAPAEFIKHHKRDTSTRGDVMQLVRLMPQAMIYSYAPAQPQPPAATTPQIVIDFHSDPAFKPPTMFAEILTGLEGRMWVDAKSRRLTRIEGHVLRPLNFGFGILAHVYPGGTIELEQTNAGGDRWVYSHLMEHLTVRAMMVKTMPENSQMTASDFRPLPAPVSFQEAVHLLLAMQIPLR